MSFHIQNRDPYNVLEIPHGADQDTIRKAYKKLALEHHPDRHLDNFEINTKKFQEISEAYENLSNMSRQKGNININDIFKDFFSELFSKPATNITNKLSIYQEIELSLDDIYKGKTITMSYERQIPRTANPNDNTCTNCNGSGRVQKFIKAENISNVISKCTNCDGIGRFSNELILQSCTVDIVIHPGFSNKTLFYDQKGHIDQYGNSGDLIINIIYIKHELFTQKGDNLHMEVKISFKESMLGIEKYEFLFLDGNIREVPIPGPLKSGTILKIKGIGLNKNSNRNIPSYLYIKLKVDPFPKKLTGKQKEVIEKYF
jgi:molecular chaperone DnaJ